ncbi:MAG TPA: hypothetical protein VH475_19290 [Tepidisphaeraceae bacterium]
MSIMKRTPLSLAVIVAGSVVLAVALVSCQERASIKSAEPVNTMWSATTVPTTQTARLLGFSFPPAPSGTGRPDAEEVRAFSRSCLVCHGQTDSHTMHETAVRLACVDCHGGRHDIDVPENLSRSDPKFRTYMLAAHVQPRNKDLWANSANPQLATTATLVESPDFVRFVNPGDLRAAQVACAGCHAEQVRDVPTSMMAHGAMLWQAAFYNNGSVDRRTAIFGEGYAPDGSAALVRPTTVPTTRQVERNGLLVELWPLMRWEISQPGNLLRVFERGGKARPVVGVPNSLEDPGRPDVKLSVRGTGTDLRTDPVNIGLQKTRLLDPTLNFMGTNDHPGDYRSSGCSACHVVYANDRSPVHSGRWAQFGNLGRSFSKDPSVNPATQPVKMSTEGGLSVGKVHLDQANTTSGHPIEHKFVRAMPTSTCIVCHVHPGTNVLNSYLGFMWWDNESDAQFMYPKQQRYPTSEDEFRTQIHNPEGSAVRGLWSNLYPGAQDHTGNAAPADFLQQLGTPEFNQRLQRVQFADFHGHGWVFRAVFKQDRHGNLLDHRGEIVKDLNATTMRQGIDYAPGPVDRNAKPAPPPDNVPVHLKDIHLEKGMQCVDCHFSQDSHGDGNLYGETRNAVMIECVDCHGDVDRESNILRYLKDTRARNADDFVAAAFTGNAAPKNPTPEQIAGRKTFLRTRFEEDGGKLWQKSALDPQKGWYVSQTSRLNPNGTPGEKAGAYAHTIRRDDKTWGAPPAAGDEQKDPSLRLAHASSTMTCYACHSSWNTSCFGCHLPQRANQRKPMLHNEGTITRNYTNYNYQTLRDDVYMLGIDSSVKGNKVVPIRSACAVMVSSQDAARQSLYTQQQTVSAEGFAGTAFSPYFPHTVRATETKQCADCHVSKDKDGLVDNNAIMAQLLLQGTNSVNFIGKWAWVAEGNGGLEAVQVTEATEPQAVIGSTLHKWAYPDFYAAHQKRGQELAEHHHHDGTVLDVQLRGEYLYAACGSDGFIAYDVANIDNKGFSERIITAPVSPLGQRFYVRSRYATSICSPSTLAIDPTRQHRPENQEQPIHPLYAYLYLTDAQEGLIVIGNPLDEKRNKAGVATLLDGDPDNNFLQRALTFNPGGLLKGARHMALHGHHAYVSCDAGVVVLDLDNPLQPRVVTTLSNFSQPRRVAFQFRYAFVIDTKGLHVLDVTDIEKPRSTGASPVLPLADARDIYLCRTYAYVAGGKDGLHIIDIERPEKPTLVQTFNADGKLNDTTAIRTGMTNSSLYAYVADGRNGLYVLQLTSPDDNPTYMGFSPRPQPHVIAHHKTRGPALAISEGLDRDRAVDEAGHQLSVFGRRGARPFTLAEMQRLYLKDAQLFTVSNTPATEPLKTAAAAPATTPASQPATPPRPRTGIPPRRPR